LVSLAFGRQAFRRNFENGFDGAEPSASHFLSVSVSRVPRLDDEVRARMSARYGDEVHSWLEDLPPVLAALAGRWQLQLGPLIPLGHMSVVIRCLAEDGRQAVLKVCPNRERLVNEATALLRLQTTHVPAVLAFDPDVGALLIEAIMPGTMFADLSGFPHAAVAELLVSLHRAGVPDASHPRLESRIAYLFKSWARHRELVPDLVEVVPANLFERGRRYALALADQPAATVLLHGDLTPVNVLDGGRRGLIAIDPAPCVGDPAFDAIDLLLCQATDPQTIVARCEDVGSAIGVNPGRLVAWCVAFAGMTASERASEDAPEDLISTALRLAERAPS
jgi:streptomycin 6-kinase